MSEPKGEQLFSVYVIFKDKEDDKKKEVKINDINNVRIERSLENLAYSFTCDCQPGSQYIAAGMKTRVFWNESEKKKKDPIFSGYIDSVTVAGQGGNAPSLSFSLSARSFASDILDSTETLADQEGNLADICAGVCELYGVEIEKDSSLKLGEAIFRCESSSPFRVLADLLRAQGGMLASNGWGVVELTQPRSGIYAKHPIKMQDVSSFSYEEDLRACFHEYKTFVDEDTELIEEDKRVRKTRKTEVPNSDETEGSGRQKIKNEKNRRLGMSQRLRLILSSWQIPGRDTHWFENTNVKVEMPQIGVSREFFVYGVILTLSKFSGYKAELLLCNRSAYVLAKAPKPSLKPSEAQGEQRLGFGLFGQVYGPEY